MQEFLFSVLQATAIELLHVFGVFFVFGFVLHLVQRATQRLYLETLGWKSLLITAWIGTPIHEIGHVIFAKLFRHTITEVSLFSPNKETGNLGHVAHSYKKTSILPRIGLFFIGAAPLLFGAFFLGLLLMFFFPNGREIFSLIIQSTHSPLDIILALQGLFHLEYLGSSWYWIFLYVSISIVSHMAPSKQDRKNMWKGLGFLTLVLFIFNAAAAAFGVALDQIILQAYQTSAVLLAFGIYSFVLALLYFVLSSILLFPIRLLFKK